MLRVKTIIIMMICILSSSSFSKRKLLDKISAIVNNETITYSYVQRILNNYNSRKTISAQIYSQSNPTYKGCIDEIINTHLIKNKLKEIGYSISDEQVEEQIKLTESRFGVGRSELLKFLKSKYINFDEYFEMTRSTIEYNFYISRVIIPLITITDQEIKNEFFKRNSQNATINYKYHIIDYSFKLEDIKDQKLSDLKEKLIRYEQTKLLSNDLNILNKNDLGLIEENGLSTLIRKNLKTVGEGKFGKPITVGDSVHYFFVKEKNLVESDLYMKNKPIIQNQLYEKASKSISKIWLLREREKYYIRVF
jgi:peptidyl-prolyl cis-trans isomerase SurA